MLETRRIVALVSALLVAALPFVSPRPASAEDEAAEAQTEQGEGEPQNEEAKADENGEAEPATEEGKDKEAKKDASPFDEIMALNAPEETDAASDVPAPGAEGDDNAVATMPIGQFSALSRRVEALRKKRTTAVAAPVVLGAASYEGEAVRGVLSLRLKLVVTLAGEGLKFVPLVGDEVALVSASADGEEIGVTRRPGYHVWVTDKKGVITLELSMLVGPRGGRGSVEYGFRAARTPSTRVSIHLPEEGLSPRVDGAIETDVRNERDGTTVRATLAPATEVRVVGFRDVGDGEAQSARAAAETLSLLSVDEHAIELFSVVRYTILRGAMQSFDVVVPEGLDVVSAEGEGAFHHSLEQRDGQTILRGETASPIEGTYELSLRLRKRGGAPSGELDVKLPHCVGVEREHGWLAVEVPGKLRIQQTSRKDLLAVSVPELPLEARSGAVSPVIEAFRYHASSPSLGISIERLPEQDLEEGAIDEVLATSVLASEGKLVTELQISLRNASRPSLAMTLPRGVEVRAALLDGEPIRPSRDDAGRVLLPLRRSATQASDAPIVLEVVLESAVPPLGLWGSAELALPAFDLGASALKWKLVLPSRDRWGDVQARLAAQPYMGAASWHKPPHIKRAVRWNDEEGEGEREARRRASSYSELLATGTEIVHQRYWIASGESPFVRVPFIRAALILPLELAAGVLVLAVAVLLSRRLRARLAPVVTFYRGAFERIPGRLASWYRRKPWTRRRAARAIALAACSLGVSWFFVERLAHLFKIAWAVLVSSA